MPEPDAVSIKELAMLFSGRFDSIERTQHTIDVKQDDQLQQLSATRLTLAILPDMKLKLDDVVEKVNNPETGVVVRLRTLERIQAEQETKRQQERDERRRESSGFFDRKTEILAAIVGGVICAVAGGVVAVILVITHLPH